MPWSLQVVIYDVTWTADVGHKRACAWTAPTSETDDESLVIDEFAARVQF